MSEQGDTFFGDEEGEAYWGFGHLNATEFVAKVNANNEELEPGEFAPVAADHVQHLHAVWTDDEPHESWRVVIRSTQGAFPVTRCAYDGYLLTVQSNRPQPQTRRDRRIAKLETALAEGRKREWALERAREEDAIDHAGDVSHANTLREKAEAALADLKHRPNQVRAIDAEEKLAWAEAALAERDKTINRLQAVIGDVAAHDRVLGVRIAAAMKKHDARAEEGGGDGRN